MQVLKPERTISQPFLCISFTVCTAQAWIVLRRGDNVGYGLFRSVLSDDDGTSPLTVIMAKSARISVRDGQLRSL